MSDIAAQSIAIGSVRDLALAIKRAQRQSRDEEKRFSPVVFFIGAGCSRSAGVPVVSEIAQKLSRRLYETYVGSSADLSKAEILTALVESAGLPASLVTEPINWPAVYDWCFEEHYRTPDDARAIFQQLIRDRPQVINWSHLCLGERVHQGFCSTVITTNFDLLALEGLTLAGEIPVVSDGLESLSRIDGWPDYPQLLQLNGSIHTYRLRNRQRELDDLETVSAIACFRDLLRSSRAFVVIGYGGRESAIMSLLNSAAAEFPDKEIFWCLHAADTDQLPEAVLTFLSHSRNAKVLLGQDSDQFFYQLCRELGVGAPGFVQDPLRVSQSQAERIVLPDGSGFAADIRGEVVELRERLQRLSATDQRQQSEDQERAISVARRRRLAGDDVGALQFLEKHLGEGAASPEEFEYAADLAISLLDKPQGIEYLRKAIEFAQKALEGYRSAAREADEADALESLAVAESALGHRLFESSYLKSAIDHLNDAIIIAGKLEYDERKLSCAGNLAVAQGQLADITKDASLYRSSTETLTEIIAGLDPDKDAAKWIRAQQNLGVTYIGLAEAGESEAFDKAAEALRIAASAATSRFAELKASALYNLGGVLLAQAKRDGLSLPLLEEAAKTYSQALEFYTKDNYPLSWAGCTVGLAQIALLIGSTGSASQGSEAGFIRQVSALEEAALIFGEEGDSRAADTLRLVKLLRGGDEASNEADADAMAALSEAGDSRDS